MSTVTHHRAVGDRRATALTAAGIDLATGLVLLLVVTVPPWWLLELPNAYPGETVALYMLMGSLILHHLPEPPPGQGLGTPNRITLARATLVLPVAALSLQPTTLPTAAYWWIIAVSTLAMVMDGVDGWIARLTDGATRFGARFDMELDAFLMLALSALVAESGKVGPWIILIGALRYLFVTGGWVWPPLSHDLPPSHRRKTICVVQGVVLLVCLGPIIPAAMATVVALGALALLLYSFGVDVWRLARRSATPSGSPASWGR